MRIITYLAVGLMIRLLRRLVTGTIEWVVLLVRGGSWLLGWSLGAAARIVMRDWRGSQASTGASASGRTRLTRPPS